MRLFSWRHYRTINPDTEYVALLSEIPFRSYGGFAGLLLFARAIFRQLRVARGLIGYSVTVQLCQKRFCTLSLWESEQSLLDFAHEGPHLVAMASLQSELRPTRFLRWKVEGCFCPPRWKDAWSRSSAGEVQHWRMSSAA